LPVLDASEQYTDGIPNARSRVDVPGTASGKLEMFCQGVKGVALGQGRVPPVFDFVKLKQEPESRIFSG
jgi:hypothetical protein